MAAKYRSLVSTRLTQCVIGLGLLVDSSAVIAQEQTLPERIAANAASVPVEARRVTIIADNAPLARVLHEIARQAGLLPAYDEATIPSSRRVNLHLRDVTVGDAFQRALNGTRLVARMRAGQQVYIVSEEGTPIVSGAIVGSVTDAKTKRPLRGVTLTLDDASRGVTTGDDGTFRFSQVSEGSRRVSARFIGYTRQVHTVLVREAQSVTVDFTLDPSASTLDQVVVTGTVVATELKAVPNAMTVITAKQIEERGITKIDQLFRGDIPGLFAQNRGSDTDAMLDEVTMFSRGATALSELSQGTRYGTNPIKTYVDGVELADAKYLSQIDPKSIERIEILTGPQASTIYGSNAINGVMQIFTKRGTASRPQLTFNMLSGLIENSASPALTPLHDYSLQLNGIEGRLSYNAGGSWNYLGRWTPAQQSARMNGFGGTRLDLHTPLGSITTDMTLRQAFTQSVQRGSQSPNITDYRTTGWYFVERAPGLSKPTTRALTGQTMGLTFIHAPTTWWSHELGIGRDVSDAEQRVAARGYTDLTDTSLYLSQSNSERRSMRYATTVRVPTTLAQLIVTVGADAWQTLASLMIASPQTLTGAITNVTLMTRQPSHNAGSFLQTQMGIKDKLFLTYGLRAEWNPDYGSEAQPNFAPRFGAAFTQELGTITAKLRGSYGRSTRPPQRILKRGQTVAELYNTSWPFLAPRFIPYYGGVIDQTLANPELSPEHQQGGEGGLELYLGSRGSLVITRYNQTVDGLIDQPVADSVRTMIPCTSATCLANSFDADGYGYYYQYQYLNVGSIRNQGWELRGSTSAGPLTASGTYSWTKSRTLGVNPKYRAFFTRTGYPQYQPGATFQYLPEHTWAFGVTYANVRSNVGLNITGTGMLRNNTNTVYNQYLSASIRLPQNRRNMRVSISGPYVSFNSGYPLANVNASHRFGAYVEGILQIQNVADRYANDLDAGNAALGRQTKIGLRVKTQ